MMERDLVDRLYKSATNGREIWLLTMNKMKISMNDYIILLPESPDEFLRSSLLYLKQFKCNTNNKVHLITTVPKLIKPVTYLFQDTLSIKVMQEEEMEAIFTLYNLYMFTDNLLILSPDFPNGRTAYNLVLNEKLSVEEYISIGIFKDSEFFQEPLVRYDGDDPDLIEFFNAERRER